MRLTNFSKWIFLFTGLALVYIHMQMQIIDLAYRTKFKEKLIKKLIEKNSTINSKILALKSSNSLGIKMLAEDTGLEFSGSKNIVRVTVATNESAKPQLNGKLDHGNKINPLLSLLLPGAQAEAKSGE